jgi:hypothetical protein
MAASEGLGAAIRFGLLVGVMSSGVTASFKFAEHAMNENIRVWQGDDVTSVVSLLPFTIRVHSLAIFASDEQVADRHPTYLGDSWSFRKLECGKHQIARVRYSIPYVPGEWVKECRL